MVLSDDLEGGMGVLRGAQEGGDICIYIYSSFTSLYSRNQHNIIKQLYSSKKNKKEFLQRSRGEFMKTKWAWC